MKALGAFLLATATLGTVAVLVVCIDLLAIPRLWPLEVDSWSLSMVRVGALSAGTLGLLGGALSLISWSKKVPAAGLMVFSLCPVVVFMSAGDLLVLGAVAQLEDQSSINGVMKRYPHLKDQITEELASRQSDPYRAYLTRSHGAETRAERKTLAEAELARVQKLPDEERLVGLQRLSGSPVGDLAHPAAAALRIKLRGLTSGPAGSRALEQLIVGAVDRGVPLNERGVKIVTSDTTPQRFRGKDFWSTCNIGGRAYRAGLLFSGTAGRFVLHRTAVTRQTTYTSAAGDTKQAHYPDFTGFASVYDPDGREVFRLDIPPGTIKPDPDLWLTAADNLDYKLSSSLSASFCLKLAAAFGGL